MNKKLQSLLQVTAVIYLGKKVVKLDKELRELRDENQKLKDENRRLESDRTYAEYNQRMKLIDLFRKYNITELLGKAGILPEDLEFFKGLVE